MAENYRENAGVSRVNDSGDSGGSQSSQSSGNTFETKSSSSSESEKKTTKTSSSSSKPDDKSDSKSDDDGGKKGKKGGKDDDAGDGKGKKDGKDDGGVVGKAANKEVERLEQKKNLMQKLHAIHMASQVISGGARFVIMAKLLNMMKMLAQMALCVVQGALQMGLGAFAMMCIQAAAQAVVNTLVAFAGWLGTTVSTVATAVVASIVTVVVILGSVVVEMVTQTPQRDWVEPCNTDASFMESVVGEATAEQIETAKMIYAVLKAYGLSDINIAGVLGNWESESQLDATAVETIYSEPRLVPVEGMKKYDAWYGSYDYPQLSGNGSITWVSAGPANFMLKFNGDMPYGKFGLRTYNGSLLSQELLESYSDEYPGIYYLGLGLGQWSNGRNVQLRNYADMHDGYEWYDLELQLMFALDPSGNGDYMNYVNMFASWGDEATPSSAADWFCENWEGIPKQENRRVQAENWYSQILTWVEGIDYDLNAAQALLSSISAAASGGGNRSGVGSLRSCSGYKLEANDSAVAAILAYAWGPGEDYVNDGTPCWRTIFGSIVGDQYFRSCDRTVATAIKWSGTDSDYPNGNVSVQATYLITSPRWLEIPWGGDKTKLLPGDVLIRSDVVYGRPAGYTGVSDVGHTLMYVGVDAVVKKFGETYNGHDVRAEGYELVSGSINTNSPHVQKFTTSTNHGANDLPTYRVYRNVEKFSNRPDWTSLSCVGGTPTS